MIPKISRPGAAIVASLLFLAACGGPESSESNSKLEKFEKLERIGKPSQDLFYASSLLWPTLYWSTGQSTTISVCWESDPQWTAHARDRQTVRAAIEDSWQRETSLHFTGWGACTSSGADVRIGVFDGNPATAALGTAVRGRANGVMFNFDYTTWSPSCGTDQTQKDFCTAAIAVHEFGHVLGFAHEQNRGDTPSWCNQRQGTDGDTTYGPWDSQSIMNYCNAMWNNNGKLSPTDIAAVQSLYGRKPSGAVVGYGSRCLDATGAGTANGTLLQSWDCNNGSQQTWRYDVATQRLVGAGSGRDVDVYGIRQDNATPLQLWDDLGGANQHWAFDRTRIRGYGGNVLGVPSGGLVSHAPVTLNAPGTSGIDDLWVLYPDHTLRPRNAQSLCVDIPYGDTSNGVALQLYPCHGGWNQQWTFIAGGQLHSANGVCVDVRGLSTSNGTPAQMWQCNGGLNQLWNLSGPITVYSGTKCMEVANYNRENGAQAQIWDCYGGANQNYDYYP